MNNLVKKILYGTIAAPKLFLNQIKKRKPRIAFANDFWEGNCKEIFLKAQNRASCFWVTSDTKTLKYLKKQKIEAYYYWNLGLQLIKPDAWVISHANRNPKKKKNTFWINAHHSIPFKAVMAKESWQEKKKYVNLLSSRIVYDHYKNDGGLQNANLELVGYPLTDLLFKDDLNREEILGCLGLNPNNKTILYAPTWSHDFNDISKKRLFPDWGKKQEQILEDVCQFMKKNNLNFIIRIHRATDKCWSNNFAHIIKSFKNVVKMSSASHPEHIPYIFSSDILITDYSSISNDFMILDRPMIFLEIDYQIFPDGFVIPPSYMIGHKVKNKYKFFVAIKKCLDNPGQFSQKRKKAAKDLHTWLDGKASQRAVDVILKRINENF